MTYVFQEEIVKMTYTWALCRDQEELDPKAAWKLLEFSAMKTNVIIQEFKKTLNRAFNTSADKIGAKHDKISLHEQFKGR